MMSEIRFYRETSFKETSMGKIPNDWDLVKLGDESVSEIVMGQSPPSSTYNKDKVGLPFLQGKMEFGDIYPSTTVYCSEPIKTAESNDVLFSVRAPVGDVNIAPYELCIGRGLAAIRFNSLVANHLFYFYYLQKVKNFLKALGKGSTFKAINKGDLENFKVRLPPLSEQRGIVEVLSVVDLAIEKVDEVIAKTERLKKGLMQELLTKGIGHKEFKNTKIGKIPKNWEMLPAEEICDRVTDGTHDTPKPVKKGYYLITSRHIRNGRLDFSEAYFISEDDFFEVNKRSKVDYGDVLFSMIGTVGMTTIVRKEYPAFAIKNVGLFKTNGDFTLAYWLSYYFQSSIAQRFIKANLKGTTQKYIPLHSLRTFLIALPSVPERRKIVEILSTLDEKLELERKEKTKLERIKRGLMDLLLTGKVRVKVAD